MTPTAGRGQRVLASSSARGRRTDNDPDAISPVFFAEEVGERPERWSDGLVVFHNPRAEIELPHAALGSAAIQYAFLDGQIRHNTSDFHVFSSLTLSLLPPRGRGVEIARRRGREVLAGMIAAFDDAGK